MKRACRHAQIFNLLVGDGGVRAMSATVGGWMGGGEVRGGGAGSNLEQSDGSSF